MAKAVSEEPHLAKFEMVYRVSVLELDIEHLMHGPCPTVESDDVRDRGQSNGLESWVPRFNVQKLPVRIPDR